jgi:hypothetical protein
VGRPIQHSRGVGIEGPSETVSSKMTYNSYVEGALVATAGPLHPPLRHALGPPCKLPAKLQWRLPQMDVGKELKSEFHSGTKVYRKTAQLTQILPAFQSSGTWKTTFVPGGASQLYIK